MRVSTVVLGFVIASFVSVAPSLGAQSMTATQTQQQSVAAADIQRLQEIIYDLSADLSRLGQHDRRAADEAQAQLDSLREEAIYLKVKLRKDGNVQRTEYWDLRDRLDALRSQVRERQTGQAQAPIQNVPVTAQDTGQPRSTNPNEVPAGADLDVKLQNPLSSATAQVEDRFEATTMVDLNNGSGRVLIPAGSVVRGVVTSVQKATRLDRKGSLTLSFDQVTIRGRAYPIHATVTQALESEGVRGEVGKIGAGAGVGAIIGGILGGVKGALAGILIGGGGTVLATPGKDVELQPGTVLRLTFDAPLVVRQ